MIGIRENKITRVPLMEAVAMVRFHVQLCAYMLNICSHVDQGCCGCDRREGLRQSNVLARSRICAEPGQLSNHVNTVHRETVARRTGQLW